MDALVRALWGWRFPGKVRLVSRLVPAAGVRSGRVFGTRLDLDLGDYVQRMMYLGCFEREETRLVRRYLRAGMTVVDVGANAGYFTYLAAARVGSGGWVVAVEPDPLLFAKLDGAARENRLANVVTANVALGRTAGELSLHIPPAGHANRAPTMVPAPGWNPVRVPVRTLDDLAADLGTIDLLKLDVEGFETEVLAGATATLAAGRVRAVLCEFNDYWLRQQGSSPAEVFAALAAAGFACPGPPPDFPPGCVVNLFLTRRPA